MKANTLFGIAAESTYGTAASISTMTPIQTPKISPTIKWLPANDLRGSPVTTYDQVTGVRHDTFTGKSYLFSDVTPNLIRSVLGGVDTVASVGASIWTHTIGLINQPNTGSQPPSYTLLLDSVDNTYQMTGSRAVDLALSFSADAVVEATLNYTGNISTTVASVSANESTQTFIPAWGCAASISGASVAVVEKMTLDIKRGTAPIFTLGQQGPYVNFAGPIGVTGSLTFIVEAGEPYYADALTHSQLPMVLQFIDPVTNYYIQFTMSKVQLMEPVIDTGQAYITIDAKYEAVANSVDAVQGGFSPISCLVRNGVSTAY
jgi:hypothetical protein